MLSQPARARARLPLALVAFVVVIGVAVAADRPLAGAIDPHMAAMDAGRRFLHRYVSRDGRVIRHDQGGDTVSEGQAYAMLVAVGVGDRERFDAVWGWTRANLQRRDGLLSWHWAHGRVTDAVSASDADLLAASALARAGERWSEGTYMRDARRIAAAMIAHETVAIGDGRVLVAGPWARRSRVVNPSYLTPIDVERMVWLTGDGEWMEVQQAARRTALALTEGWPHLPPDWATAGHRAGGVWAASSPDGTSPRYGLDASRLLVALAIDCDSRGRAAARRAWSFFDGQLAAGRRIVAVYGLDGAPLVDYEHPVALVAAAAAADVAYADDVAQGLLRRAEQLDATSSTYYGSAWIALGRLMLDTDTLGRCPP